MIYTCMLLITELALVDNLSIPNFKQTFENTSHFLLRSELIYSNTTFCLQAEDW